MNGQWTVDTPRGKHNFRPEWHNKQLITFAKFLFSLLYDKNVLYGDWTLPRGKHNIWHEWRQKQTADHFRKIYSLLYDKNVLYGDWTLPRGKHNIWHKWRHKQLITFEKFHSSLQYFTMCIIFLNKPKLENILSVVTFFTLLQDLSWNF